MIEGEDGYAVVATTRPETIMGDTAMCINPNDPKNTQIKKEKKKLLKFLLVAFMKENATQ